MKKVTLILTALALTLSAGTLSSTQKVRVVSSEPIYKTVAKQIPYQECREEIAPRREVRHYSNHNDSPLGTLIGGVAGGIIGNQVGKGRGNTLATVGGAVIGSIVGHNLSSRDYTYETNSYYPTHTREVCRTEYHTEYAQEFIGFKNIAYLNGEKIVKITPHKERFIFVTNTLHY